jgi:hypothetical protein
MTMPNAIRDRLVLCTRVHDEGFQDVGDVPRTGPRWLRNFPQIIF